MKYPMNNLNESYSVEFGYDFETPAKTFDKLEDAIKFINDGMKKKESQSYTLFNNGKEMIWLDAYRDRNYSDVGYTVSRHNDKSIEFDKSKGGLVIKDNTTAPEDNKVVRELVVSQAFKIKAYSAGQAFNKCRFVLDNKNESHIDLESSVVYYNDYEEIPVMTDNLVKDFKAKKESLTELFGFGKKKSNKNLYIVAMFRDSSGRLGTGDVWRKIYWIIKEHVSSVKDSHRKHFNEFTLGQYEFVATENEFSRIKHSVDLFVRNLNSNPKYFEGNDYVNGKGEDNPDIKRSAANLIKFDCIEQGIKESLDEATNYDFSNYKLRAEILIEREYGEEAEYHLMNYHKYYKEFEPEYILLYELVDQGKFVVVITGSDTIEEFDTITDANKYWDEFFSEPEDVEESLLKDTADNWHTQEW